MASDRWSMFGDLERERRASREEMAREAPKEHGELERASSKMETAILEFCRKASGTFTAADLFQYVSSRLPCSPSSPDRVLRLLRKKGWVDYEVESRTSGLHRILWCK